MGRHQKEWPEKDEQTERQYVTVTMIARHINQSRTFVREAIERNELPGVKVPSKFSRGGFEWNVLLEDAEAYAIENTKDVPPDTSSFVAHSSEITEDFPEKLDLEEGKLPEPESKPLGTPDCCGSCGLTTGNILGDVDEGTQYGYLCFRCYKLVQMFHGDTLRMGKVLTYLDKTRR